MMEGKSFGPAVRLFISRQGSGRKRIAPPEVLNGESSRI
jgi:hypothetical protein